MFDSVLNTPLSLDVNEFSFDEEPISLICMKNQQKIKVFLIAGAQLGEGRREVSPALFWKWEKISLILQKNVKQLLKLIKSWLKLIYIFSYLSDLYF